MPSRTMEEMEVQLMLRHSERLDGFRILGMMVRRSIFHVLGHLLPLLIFFNFAANGVVKAPWKRRTRCGRGSLSTLDSVFFRATKKVFRSLLCKEYVCMYVTLVSVHRSFLSFNLFITLRSLL